MILFECSFEFFSEAHYKTFHNKEHWAHNLLLFGFFRNLATFDGQNSLLQCICGFAGNEFF